MKQLVCLFLFIFVSSTFASNYQQTSINDGTKKVAVYIQIDKANVTVVQLKTIEIYHPKLNLLQTLMVKTSIPLVARSANSHSNNTARVEAELHGQSAQIQPISFRPIKTSDAIEFNQYKKSNINSGETVNELSAVNAETWDSEEPQINGQPASYRNFDSLKNMRKEVMF